MGNIASDETHPIVKNKKKKRKKERKKKQKQKYSKTATEPSSSSYTIEDAYDDVKTYECSDSFSYSHASSQRILNDIKERAEELGLRFPKSPTPENSNEYNSDNGEYSQSYSTTFEESVVNEMNVPVYCDYLEAKMHKKMYFSQLQYVTNHKAYKQAFEAEIKEDLSGLNELEKQHVCKQFKVKYSNNIHNITKNISNAMHKKMYPQKELKRLLDYTETDKIIDYFSQYLSDKLDEDEDKVYIKKQLSKLNKKKLKQICKQFNLKNVPKNKNKIVNQIFAVMEKQIYIKAINDQNSKGVETKRSQNNHSSNTESISYLETNKIIHCLSQCVSDTKQGYDIKKQLSTLNTNELKKMVNQIFVLMEKEMHMKTNNDSKGGTNTLSARNNTNNVSNLSNGNQSQSNQSSNNWNNANNFNNKRNNDNNSDKQNHQPNDNDENKFPTDEKENCNVPAHRLFDERLRFLEVASGDISVKQKMLADTFNRVLNNMKFHDPVHDDVKRNDDSVVNIHNNDLILDEEEDKKIMLEELDEVKNNTDIIVNYEYKINLSKILTSKIIFEKVKEKLLDPYKYMQRCERLYGINDNQLIKRYEIGNKHIAIANYYLHCKKSNQILYIPCEIVKNGKYNYKQKHQLFTHEEIHKYYGIPRNELPRITTLRLAPDVQAMQTIRGILHNEDLRKTLINKTKWGKIPIRNYVSCKKGAKGLLSYTAIQVENFKNIIHKFADENMQRAEVIPIVSPDKDEVEYAWIVLIVKENRRFNIGISLQLENMYKCKVGSIFLSLVDAYHLIAPNFRNNKRLSLYDMDRFVYDVNMLRIGTGYEHKIDELQEKIRQNKIFENEKTIQKLQEEIAIQKQQILQLENSLKITTHNQQMVQVATQQMIEFATQIKTYYNGVSQFSSSYQPM